ncbi:protein BTG2 isoform X1 [Haemorhous mexicanus]|uniref:protein BTG2 isoform X1 n=1 Tax=Haemorhous mexicanus TaxID=30427 RepID=UPI0028BD293A|nr:protein BTG2 isoform X1 [Haemorhous mexicanus]
MSHRHSQRRGPRADMAPEIAAAVGFVSGLLRTRGCVSEQQLQVFSGALREALTEHYRHHWFPKKPLKRKPLKGFYIGFHLQTLNLMGAQAPKPLSHLSSPSPKHYRHHWLPEKPLKGKPLKGFSIGFHLQTPNLMGAQAPKPHLLSGYPFSPLFSLPRALQTPLVTQENLKRETLKRFFYRISPSNSEFNGS